MKKQNNILTLWKQILGLFTISFLLNACSDEQVFNSNQGDIVEGIPIEVNFNFAASSMEKITTRGLPDNAEFQINNLYVLIFNANGNKDRKEGSRFYDNDDIIDAINGSQNGTSSTGKLKLKTTSGESLIYGIANVKGNELGGDALFDELEKVSKLSDLESLTAQLSTQGNVSRAAAALVMSGAYKDESTQSQSGYCAIPATQNGNITLSGKIILSRLDSHITFKVNPLMVGSTRIFNGEAVRGKIKSFTPTSWKVYNVPVKSYVLAKDKDAADIEGEQKDNYDDTRSSINFNQPNENTYNFDFYMLENRKESQNNITDYAQREKEEKTNEGMNTGVYTYVKPYATFVEIKAHMEIENNNTDNGIRIADVTYVVHLGYVNDNPADFNNLRNKKYTYNINIIDVENIVAEVEDGNELQPGAEGDVVDSKTEVFNIDSHYGYIILGFSYKDVETRLNFYVKTPYGETTEKNLNDKSNHDYSWIKFKRNTSNSASKLEVYPQNGKDLIDLFGLEADIKNRYKEENSKDENKIYYYTAYIDEYYYEQNPLANGEIWTRAKWEEFANKDNRYVLLLFSPQYSNDHESSYAGAKFMITQKSIQTYYSNSETALGMEHENETGAPTYKGSSMGSNTTYGYANIYNKWNNASLNTYTQQTVPSNNTFAMSNNSYYRDAIYDCMSRNRDENGDGYIKGEEIKWYLPATQQLVGMFLGAESLTSPLFSNADKRPEIEGGRTVGTYHYITSNDQRIWAEEGASFGPAAPQSYVTSAEKLRCVRNLGVNPKDQVNKPNVDYVGTVYSYNSQTRTFSMNNMDAHSIRTSYIDRGELALHHNFDPLNMPYHSFQVAQKAISTSGKDKYLQTTWINLVKKDNLERSVCANYSEESNDLGMWRAPNQRELMIMYMQDKSLVKGYMGNSQYGSYSRTGWKFDMTFHFGVDTELMYMDRAGSGGSYVRCVRDRNKER